MLGKRLAKEGEALWTGRVRELRPERRSALAVLAVATPGRHLRCEAGPHETTGDEAPGCPNARMGQAVNDVKDGAMESRRNEGVENS
jgi:hypothetical protein